MIKRLPIIAIVGRPNVGKSTLFNRLIGRKYAVTSKVPGTTRDRLYHPAVLDEYRVMMVDTGGLEFEKLKNIEEQVQVQAKIAIADADIIYFVLDASAELTASDYEAATLLRKTSKRVMLIANKSDKKLAEKYLFNLYELGFGDPLLVSSIHAGGVQELIEESASELKRLGFEPAKDEEQEGIRLAIVGRPNVGKSTMFNRIAGEERAIVSDEPGTTRDTIDTVIKRGDDVFTLIDTAGMRRKGKVGMSKNRLEKYSVIRGLDAVFRSDVVLLLLDHQDGITNQDCHVSQSILEAEKGIIIVMNKSDLMEDPEKEMAEAIHNLQHKMDYLSWAPIIFVSGKNGRNINKLFDLAKEIYLERRKRVNEDAFQRHIRQISIKHAPPSVGSHFTKLYAGRQNGTEPPSFIIDCNHPESLHFSYLRYIENSIRRKFGFVGTPMHLDIRRPASEKGLK